MVIFEHEFHAIVPDGYLQGRADKVIAEVCGCSRSAISQLIQSGQVLVNDKAVKSSATINPGDRIIIVPNLTMESETADSETPDIRILFEDDDIILINKPAGISVHPGAGGRVTTVMDVIVQSRPEIIGVGQRDRWGIVHRLDKDTSGVMVVARSTEAYTILSSMFKEHSIHRRYMAIVRGNPGADSGVIDKPLGRHATDRKRISTRTNKARYAKTNWKVYERFGKICLLEITPETGRTHQIRAHLASIGLPIAGDQVYGYRKRKAATTDPCENAAEKLRRQALHAAYLGITHPKTGEFMDFRTDLPDDMADVVRKCREFDGMSS